MNNIKRYLMPHRVDRPDLAEKAYPPGSICYEVTSAPFVLAVDHDAAIAAKDARIAELETALQEISTGNHGYSVPMAPIVDAALAAHQQAEPATHSEDGREAPDVVAWLNEEWGTVTASSVVVMDWDDSEDRVSSLMSVAQHERIVAAMEAEIARLNLELKDADEHGDREELRANGYAAELVALRAQPARQVVDEREQFEAYWRYSRRSDDGEPGNTPARCKLEGKTYAGSAAEYAWVWWQRGRAALAPAAVVMPERMTCDDGYPTDDWLVTNAHNRALDAVTRLNRRAIPVDLLERMANCTDPDCCIAYERDELRALLGKDGSE